MFSLILFAICVVCGLFYWQRVRRMTFLRRYGIPGPKPHLIYGNLKDYNTLGYNQCFDKWKEKYGRIFGFYLGAKPFVVVTDPELLKLIQIKDFHHFSHRPYIIPGGIYRNWKYHQMVTRVESFRWKKMRTILSPWFSSSQLKSVVAVINVCVDQMIKKMDRLALSRSQFNIYELLEGMAMDSIDRSAFGVQTDIQDQVNGNPLIEATRGVFAIKPNQVLTTLLLCFPEFSVLINILRDICETLCDRLGDTSHGLLLKAGQTILNSRLRFESQDINKRADNQRKDMLQLLVEARNNGQQCNHSNGLNGTKRNKGVNAINNGFCGLCRGLTDVEVVANIVVVHEAAYESPANILAFIIHNLINYPDIQQKCFQEINHLYNKDLGFGYNVMSGLPFTEAVICETFRLFPTDTLFTSRSPDIDYAYEGLVIPKGVDIRIPTFQLHRDPDLWPNADQFDPNRFLKNDSPVDPVVYQPFGVGPRVCPGKRFAFLEIKLALAKLLHRYKLIAGSRTEIGSIELDFKLITLSPKNGVWVKLVDRNYSN